jgi:hypothetical protein
VRIDDGPLQPTPFRSTLPRDGRRHGIVVVAEGFLPSAQFLLFDRDLDLRFSLEPDDEKDRRGGGHRSDAEASRPSRDGGSREK